MQNTRRIWILLLAALLLTGLFACNRSESAAGGNGGTVAFDFSDNTNGVPKGWTVNSYEGGYTTFYEDGACGFSVPGEDDCRLIRTVDVEPGTRYVLTAEVRTENVMDGQGATLSIDNYAADGSFIYSEPLFGTNGWTTVTLAFRTAKEQASVTLALRLGGYSAESSGAVWFRNVSLVQTDVASVAFQDLNPYKQSSETEDDRTAEDYEAVFTVIFWVGAIAAIVLLYGAAPRINERSLLKEPRPNKYRYFAAIVLIGLVVRFILCAKLKGHSTDMNCWQGWGRMIVEGGPAKFYPDNWCDYPPGYMLVLGLLYRIASIFPEGAFRLFVYMLPAFLCDALSGFLILNRAKRFALGERTALFLAGLIVLNPAAVYLSGAWGQIDSILTVLLIGAFLLLNESREKPHYRLYAGILYGFAIVMKWQALIFGPVLVLMYVMLGIDQWNTKGFVRHVLWSVAGLVGAVAVLLFYSLLFRGEGMGLFWMAERYQSASSGYDYATVEAYNCLALFGGNWNKAGNALFGNANIWEMFLRVNELFSKVALVIGFPTLVLRAWKSMRTRTNRQKNTAFYELLTAAILAGVMALLLFIGKNFISKSEGMNDLLHFIGGFPLYGLLMLGMFMYIVRRESKGRKPGEWVREGGVTAVGALTLLLAACMFALTFLLGVLFRLFGGALTWKTFGIIGIVLAGAATLGLFLLYRKRHRRANYSLYTNRGLIFLLAACFCVWVFTFGHYMHERYIFPALFFLVFAYAYDRDPHKLYALCMLTVTTFMNEMMAMFVVSKGANELVRGGTIHNQLIAVISLLEVAAVFYMTATVLLRALRFDPGDPQEESPKRDADKPRKKGGRR